MSSIKLAKQTRIMHFTDVFHTRNKTSGDLVMQWTRQQIGDRAFSAATPQAWNWLQTELKLLQLTTTFHRPLKIFLFQSAYGHRIDWLLFCDAPSVFSKGVQYKWLSYSYNSTKTHNVGKTDLSFANRWYKVISDALYFIDTWITFV